MWKWLREVFVGPHRCGDYWEHDWIDSVKHFHPTDTKRQFPYYQCRHGECREVTHCYFYDEEKLLKQATDLIN